LVTEDQEHARAFIESLRAQESMPSTSAAHQSTDEDLDALENDDDYCQDDDDLDDDAFYADAFGDEPWEGPS